MAFASISTTPYSSLLDQLRECSNFQASDAKYENCSNLGDGHPTVCEILKKLHEAKEFRKYALAIIPIVLSVIALITNVAFGVISVVLWRQGRSSKKRSVFLLSRTVSTIIALLLFYVVVVIWKIEAFDYASSVIFIVLGGVSFLTLTGTYLAMTSLLYTAIVHPFRYKKNVTLSRCTMVVAAIWTISAGLFMATLFYPESSPVHCAFLSCQHPWAISVVVILALFYFLVLAFYGGMLYRIHRRRRRTFTENNNLSQRIVKVEKKVSAMNRLGINMASFAVSSTPILVVSIIAAANLDRFKTLGTGVKDHCKTFNNATLFFEVQILASVAAIVWLLGMIIDPIINALSDPKFLAFFTGFSSAITRQLTTMTTFNSQLGREANSRKSGKK